MGNQQGSLYFTLAPLPVSLVPLSPWPSLLICSGYGPCNQVHFSKRQCVNLVYLKDCCERDLHNESITAAGLVSASLVSPLSETLETC